ncbi:hypothetical protein, partial [Corynebacterium amycolatum]
MQPVKRSPMRVYKASLLFNCMLNVDRMILAYLFATMETVLILTIFRKTVWAFATTFMFAWNAQALQ